MWRNPVTTMTIPLSPLLLVPGTLLLLVSPIAHGVVHTEGGSFSRDLDQYPSPFVSGDEFDGDETDVIQLVQPPRTSSGQRQLASIVDELSQARSEQGLSSFGGEESIPLDVLIEAARQQRIRDRNARESDDRKTYDLRPDPIEGYTHTSLATISIAISALTASANNVALVVKAKFTSVSSLGRSSPSAPNSVGYAELERFGEEIRELQRQQASNAASSMLPVYEPQPMEVIEEEEGKKTKVVESTKKTTAKSEKKARTPAVENSAAMKQKKGEEEFVEFADPSGRNAASNKLRNLEYMEKRVADRSRLRADDSRMLGLLSSSGNILFVAFITMCCALTVVGIVGGTYYYRHIREEREDPFDDFTRYSPAGPGKQLKKGQMGNFGSEKGDEALAYRAQLHHYQQSKQKIIGAGDDVLGSPNADVLNGRDGIAGPVDDDTDKSEDEGEYSVYECPGLAPTGDIEVQNPNFVDTASTVSKSQRVPSPHTSPQHKHS